MTNAEYDGTWLKAVLFVNRALDGAGEFEERAFWAACSLKLLAHGAVMAHSSSLPDSLHRNIFRVCQSLTSSFDAVSANGIEASRVRYLDSGEAFCSSITPSAWWYRYWPLVDVLLSLHDRQLAELVGTDQEPEVKEILCGARESVAVSVHDLMRQAANVVERRHRGELTADETQTIAARTQTHHSLAARQRCPVCGDAGWLRGDTPLAAEDSAAPSPAIATEAFVCAACGLVLRGPEAIRATGLPESFTEPSDGSAATH